MVKRCLLVGQGNAPPQLAASSIAGAFGVSHRDERSKRTTLLRDVAAFVGLMLCILILVVIGRAAIDESAEQIAETSFGPVSGDAAG